MSRFLRGLAVVSLLAALQPAPVLAEARLDAPAYAAPRAVFDFYFDDPKHIGSALFWVRSVMNTLSEAPYGYAPEDMQLVVVVHGTEIVTLAKHNAAKYPEAVERMRYYADLGVRFRVCGDAARDYGYRPSDFQDFVEIAPNAIADLVHWQRQGYALIAPRIMDRKVSIEAIR